MDIEPPHHPIETRRDFFIHLFTITCGLFIALSIESGIDWLHHRSLVSEARTNIRQELVDNQESTRKDLAELNNNIGRFQHNLVEVRVLRDHPKALHGSMEYTFSWDSPSDAAWRTARDTGALAYMSYAEVQRYTDLYGQQAIVNASAVQLLHEQIQASAPIATEEQIDNLSKDEVNRLLHETAATYADLRGLGQILTQLRDQYTATLKTQ